LLPNRRGGIITHISKSCTKAKGTRLLTKSQLLPNKRDEIIAQN
jgi:hypothetical protein